MLLLCQHTYLPNLFGLLDFSRNTDKNTQKEAFSFLEKVSKSTISGLLWGKHCYWEANKCTVNGDI